MSTVVSMHSNMTGQQIRQGGFWICGVVVVFCINANLALAQTAAQKQVLKKCVALVLPSWLPPGFKMTTFETEDCSTSRFPGYTITYKGPSQCAITLSGSNGGWGADGPVREWKVKTKLFGTLILEEKKNYAGGSNHLFAGAWNPPYFKAYPNTGYVYLFECNNKLFNVNDAQRIIQSSALAP